MIFSVLAFVELFASICINNKLKTKVKSIFIIKSL